MTAPWATGKHKPRRKTASRRGLGKVAGRAWRGFQKRLGKHPWLSMLLQIALGIVVVVMLLLGVFLESFLYYLVMAVAGLATLAVRRAETMERTRRGVPPKPSTGGPRTAPPPPKPSAGPEPAAGGVVKCTGSGQPADTCECATRHVTSEKGVKRYGLPLGSPLGRKKTK